jgi:hypothetical protein
MAFGSKTSATQLTTITNTEQFFTTFVTLTPGELIHCEVEIDFPATSTDDATVAVYGTLDASSESWDEEPLLEFNVPTGGNASVIKKAFVITGVYKFRVGVRREDGGTETLDAADFSFRRDNVSL